ncbi:hypothetical protein GN244_ATG18975 [Phytophthora infestans]|uniref:M96 mating-specific protein family n=1 Tax=Phytophthora infestans TaxID=4787 RepID=A0A833SEV8_PHYIN|nr:hypothetical protein GN244_ATG18975 [Phytophthora infestans]
MKLKMQYENEKQLVKILEKMLHKRHVPANDTEPQATKQTRRTDIPDGYIERMAAMIFQDLAAGVKVCYTQLKSVFETTRPVPMDLVSHNGLLDEGKKLKGIERKFYDRRTMPFGMCSTGDAWWENWHNYRGQRFQDIAANEITESFDKRIVFVWDAYVEPFGFANERVSGVYLLEQNYVLIEPEFWSSERTRGRSNGSATRVSTCYVITPYFLDPKLKDDPKTMAVINFLVSALSTNIMALSEMVETLLLDQVLQR